MGQIKKDIKQLFKSAGNKGKAINEAKSGLIRVKQKVLQILVGHLNQERYMFLNIKNPNTLTE